MKHIIAEFSACETEGDSALWDEVGLEAWALEVATGHGFSGIKNLSRPSEDGSVALVILAEGIVISILTSAAPRSVLLDAIVSASDAGLLAEARLILVDVAKRFRPHKIVDREIDRPDFDWSTTNQTRSKSQIH